MRWWCRHCHHWMSLLLSVIFWFCYSILESLIVASAFHYLHPPCQDSEDGAGFVAEMMDQQAGHAVLEGCCQLHVQSQTTMSSGGDVVNHPLGNSVYMFPCSKSNHKIQLECCCHWLLGSSTSNHVSISNVRTILCRLQLFRPLSR